MTKYKIIVNPVSGRGGGKKSIPLIKQFLQKYHLDFEIVCTERPLHALELAKEAVVQGYNVVVAAGGDGTANEVLNGLMIAKETGLGESALGLLSVGRGNDMAYGMNVPADLENACEVLAQGYFKHTDIGRITGGDYPEGRYFGNGVGIGFDAVVGFEAAKLTHLSGFACYLVAALKTMAFYYTAPTTHIEYNGSAFTQPSLIISVMNGRRLGGGFFMAPESITDDGKFDLCIGKQVSRLRILPLILRFTKGTQASHPAIKVGRTQRITITALTGSLPAHADGETICFAGKQLHLEIVPKAIKVICNHPNQSQDVPK